MFHILLKTNLIKQRSYNCESEVSPKCLLRFIYYSYLLKGKKGMKNLYLITLMLCTSKVMAVNYFVEGGLHFGGDELAIATLTNGDTEKIKGGQLFLFSAGIAQGFAENIEGRLMLGVKYDSISADNGDIDFIRFPIEAFAFYKVADRINIGGGLSYHLNPSLNGDGIATAIDADFDNALGFALVAEYMLKNGGYLAIKLTSIDYDVSGVSASGNSIGGILGFRF